MLNNTPTIASLAAQLKMRGEILDAFGPTADGELMRLAGATLIEFEQLMGKLVHLEAEVRRLEREIHHA